MVDYIDNKYFLSSDKAINLIEILVQEHMPEFKEIDKFNHGIYFGLVYRNNSIEIRLGSGRGFLEFSLKKGDENISLIKFDERLIAIEAASEQNIRFTRNNFV